VYVTELPSRMVGADRVLTTLKPGLISGFDTASLTGVVVCELVTEATFTSEVVVVSVYGTAIVPVNETLIVSPGARLYGPASAAARVTPDARM
jgi:hypothetical protein